MAARLLSYDVRRQRDSLMKVKLFWKINPVAVGLKNARALEDEINVWLGEKPGIKIANINQSSSGGSFFGSLWFVSIWNEEGAG